MKIEGKSWCNKSWVDVQKVSKKAKKICGIYSIEVPSMKMAYIGQSLSIKNRWHQHKSVLKKGKSEIIDMQNIWNSNKDLFEFHIIEECIPELLKQKEKEHAEDYIKRGYDLFNSYFIINGASIFIDVQYKEMFNNIMKLHAKGRLDIEKLKSYLDTL